MQTTVIFKGLFVDGKYRWENVAEVSPKQLYTVKNDLIAKAFPKVNQQYIIRYKRLECAEMIDPYEIIEHYLTCSYWQVVGDELIFKKGKNKGLSVTQYTSAFVNNPEEEKSFVKSLAALYKKSNNIYTRNNIMRIFNSGKIKYCDIFGYGGSIILSGSYKGLDITKVMITSYMQVRNRLDYFMALSINPITKDNCERWIKYLDQKFEFV